MDTHHNFTVEELVLNSSFRKWVKEKEYTEDQFWRIWVDLDIQREKTVEEAQWLIGLMKENDFMNLSEDELRQDIAMLMSNIRNGKKQRTVYKGNQLWKYMAAASVFLLGGYFYYHRLNVQEAESAVEITNSREVLQYSNDSSHSLTFLLPDSSTMVLEPMSKATFSQQESNERKVELTGEAFFDVRKNPHRPFIVLSNKLITKVLGTKFKVNSSAAKGIVQVEVISGKVSVFRKMDWEKSKSEVQTVASGVVLTANQKVDFIVVDGTFSKKLIDIPEKITKVNVEDFEFVQTPVTDVFERIQKVYAIEIVFDSTLLADCKLNASLVDENMYEKIRLICQSIGATFQEVDARIIINAPKGCN